MTRRGEDRSGHDRARPDWQRMSSRLEAGEREAHRRKAVLPAPEALPNGAYQNTTKRNGPADEGEAGDLTPSGAA